MHPMKEDQYITVLFLQKLKMSTWICTGHELGAEDHWKRRERLKVKRGVRPLGLPSCPFPWRQAGPYPPVPGSWPPPPLGGAVWTKSQGC